MAARPADQALAARRGRGAFWPMAVPPKVRLTLFDMCMFICSVLHGNTYSLTFIHAPAGLATNSSLSIGLGVSNVAFTQWEKAYKV